MTILLSSDRHMFDVFALDGVHYLTVTTGGVGQYDVTIRLTEREVDSFRLDENKAIAMAIDVATRTSAYAGRIVHPPLDPA